MASTYSNLKIQLMTTGENATTWGAITNTNLGTAIEEAISGSADVTFASNNVTLTLSNTNATQTARNMRLNLTGTTGGSTRTLTVPNIEKVYIVNNGCSDPVEVKNSAGVSVTVPAGKSVIVFSTGTGVVDAINYTSVANGGTGTDTLSPNAVILGNGANAVQTVAPGTAGNVLTSNGTTWASTGLPTFGTMASQNANNVTITGGSISGITDLAVADGGTGVSTIDANAVVLGNGTSPVQTVAPGTSGNVLTSNGTTWSSTAPSLSTSSFTGSNQSLSTSGYQKLPGGLIIQWGSSTGGSTVTFPVAFPSAVVSITGSPKTADRIFDVTSSSKTSFVGWTGNTSGGGTNDAFFWMAIGY